MAARVKKRDDTPVQFTMRLPRWLYDASREQAKVEALTLTSWLRFLASGAINEGSPK